VNVDGTVTCSWGLYEQMDFLGTKVAEVLKLEVLQLWELIIQ
jgi:hypothetical protein